MRAIIVIDYFYYESALEDPAVRMALGRMSRGTIFEEPGGAVFRLAFL